MAETIVLALNGGTGSRAALDWVGSVAHDLLISMPCPVVVVPPPADTPLLIPNAEQDK